MPNFTSPESGRVVRDSGRSFAAAGNEVARLAWRLPLTRQQPGLKLRKAPMRQRNEEAADRLRDTETR